jgi:DNA-binding beta-propeller fold protein YncE
MLAVSDHTGGNLTIVDPAGAKVVAQVELRGSPAGAAWSADGKSVFVAECDAGSVAEVDALAGKVLRRLPTGPRPVGLALAARKGLLLVADSANDAVTVLDLRSGKEKARLPVVREPCFLAVTPDEATAVVGNLLPQGDASRPTHSAVVSLIDLDKLAPAGQIKLPPGSTNVRQIAVSPTGRWAYVAHTLGRFMLPTTQLEHGWMNTNAVTILDLAGKKVYCTLLLDLMSEGAADPWGLAMTRDGSTMFVAIAGCHQIARLDLAKLHRLLRSEEYIAASTQAARPAQSGPAQTAAKAKAAPPATTAAKAAAKAAAEAAEKKSLAELEQYRRSGVQNAWLEIRHDATRRDLLINDLAALHVADIMTRTPLAAGLGPRGIALSPDGRQLAVAAYFSGAVVLAKVTPPPAPQATAAEGQPEPAPFGGPPTTPPSIFTAPPPFLVTAAVPLGPQPAADQARAGEQIFHDATYCFQHWLSCATCHPEGRADGLNWDLLNDGIGNPKNVKSLLGADKRAPMMAHGVRPSFATAVESGFKFILFRQPAAVESKAVQAYLGSLRPTPSPRLLGGRMSPQAQRGRQIFEGKSGCATCHAGPQLTDLKSYDVGTKRDFDTSGKFVTPTLIELWRTAPYLHDGSAATIMDLLTKGNQGDQHGSTSHLSKAELEDLAEYLLSL